MDKSWVHLRRNCKEYADGMRMFLDDVFAKVGFGERVICPCKKCCNRYRYERNIIQLHLIEKGMDPTYMNGPWRHHGEPMTNLPFQEDIESVHNMKKFV